MYSIGIDRKDRLWLVDSDNNRIFMLPLTNETDTEPWSKYIGGWLVEPWRRLPGGAWGISCPYMG